MTKVKWLVALIAAAGFVAALAQDYPCDVYLRSAKIYLFRDNPDYESALKNLEAGYQKCYNDPLLHELLGRIYADQGKLERMTQEFKIAKEKGHSKPEELNKVIETVWGKEFKNGTTYLEQADTIKQRMADLDTVSSDSLRQAEQQKLTAGLQKAVELAAKHFENCILVDSSRYQPYVNAAAQRLELNQLEKADTLLSLAYQLTPESLSVVLSYGINLYNLQNYDKAIEIFEKAVKIDPNNREALINLASLYGVKNERQKAREIWDKLIEKGMANKDVYFNSGFVHLADAEELVRQVRNLEDSLQKSPKTAGLKEEIARLNEQRKANIKDGISDFTKSLELDSTDIEAIYYLGYLHMLNDDLKEAMETLEKVVAMKPDHKAAWARLAIVYTLKGMKEKAKEADEKSK